MNDKVQSVKNLFLKKFSSFSLEADLLDVVSALSADLINISGIIKPFLLYFIH